MIACNCFGAELIYLSCEIDSVHFDFTLNEDAGTVSFYVKDAKAANVEKAIFEVDRVTWVTNMSHGGKLIRSINRKDLTFTQDVFDLGLEIHDKGQCKLVDKIERKF
jgi:hypothetical protein